MKIKRAIFYLCAAREAVKMVIVMLGILFVVLPGAWAEGETPLLIVALAEVGIGFLIRGLWAVTCKLDGMVHLCREWLARWELTQSAEYRRYAEWRAGWVRWFKEQEREERREANIHEIAV